MNLAALVDSMFVAATAQLVHEIEQEQPDAQLMQETDRGWLIGTDDDATL